MRKEASMEYCVYITTYSGDRLPSKYIGSSSVKRVENGYKGSVSSKKWKNIWREELKTNPNLFSTEIVFKCSSREEAASKELELQKQYDAIRSLDWVNEGYASINGYAGRNVKGENNPMYNRGDLARQWCINNPEKASARNRKAAITQWSNQETRNNRIKSMRGKKKTFKDESSFRELQRKKSLISKEKRSIRLEYNGVVYVGWRELYEATGVSKHLYKKYYMKGIDPSERIGKNGPAPHSERR